MCSDRAEIVANFLKKALVKYNAINKKLPLQIAIYRDGVGGPSYQEKVIRVEVDAVNAAI